MVSVEISAGDEGDVLFDGVGKEFERVYTWSKRDPDKEAASRFGPGGGLWEMALKRFKHGVAAFAVSSAEFWDVRLEEPAAGDFEGDMLVEGAGLEVSRVLGEDEFVDEGFCGNHPADPEARGKGL